MDRPPRGVGSGLARVGARPAPAALALLAVMAGAFLLSTLLDVQGWASQHLALHPRAALGREPWQLLTSALVHFGLGALVISAIGVWIFGSLVEGTVGRRRMLAAFVLSQIGGSLAIAAIGRVAAPELTSWGAQLGITGLIGAFGVASARVPVSPFGLFTVRGGSLALGLVVLSLVQLAWMVPWHVARVELAGTVVAALVGAATLWRMDLQLGRRWQKWRLWRARRRYRVISGGLDTPRRQLS